MSAPLSAPKEPLPAHTERINAPDWEVPQDPASKSRLRFGGRRPAAWAVSDRFDRVLPPHRRYFGRSRRTLLIVVLAILILLLALIIGLAVGLSKRSKHQSLPLPKDGKFTGDLTYYEPALGACGIVSTPKQDIVAVSHFRFDDAQTGSNPNLNPLCGKKIRAQTQYKGKTVTVDLTVVDRCTGCQPGDIDVSPAVFDKLADHDKGRVPVTWAFL